jgi:hypothetical protein
MFLIPCEVWGSHDGEYKDYCLLGRDAIQHQLTYPEDEDMDSSETLKTFYQTTWHHIPEDGNLHL